MREVSAQGGGIAPIAKQPPQPELVILAEAALGAAVEQRDQVEAGVADPRALAVDDAGDSVLGPSSRFERRRSSEGITVGAA